MIEKMKIDFTVEINEKELLSLVRGTHGEESDIIAKAMLDSAEVVAERARTRMRADGANYEADNTKAFLIRHPHEWMDAGVANNANNAVASEEAHHYIQSAGEAGPT